MEDFNFQIGKEREHKKGVRDVRCALIGQWINDVVPEVVTWRTFQKSYISNIIRDFI